MKKVILYTLSCLFALMLSCREEPRERISNEVTIQISDNQWTYFSIETGSVVGTSAFSSLREDSAWFERNDWDIAVCGEFIRTNSGTSGKGNGGILRNQTTDFYNLVQAPERGYLVDTNNIVIK